MLDPEPLRALINIGLRERDAICNALRADRNDAELQREIADWNAGTVKGWFPTGGETPQLLDQFRSRSVPGEFARAYQQSCAAVIHTELGTHLLPKLEAAKMAHEALLNEARQAYEKSQTILRTFEAHCGPFNDLVDVVNALSSASAATKQAGKVRAVSAPERSAENKVSCKIKTDYHEISARLKRLVDQGEKYTSQGELAERMHFAASLTAEP